MPDIDNGQAEELYRALRQYLAQSSDGEQLISLFEADPEEGSAALADYLRERLPQDDALARQLASALGGENQLATIVTGGQVDQIVNIARLGVLNLTVKRHLSVFRDVKQVALFLSFLLAIGTGIGFGAWRLSQPGRMSGDFNIAVAEFSELPEAPDPTLAPIASQMLFSFLDAEYELGEFGLEIQVAHDKIGAIPGAAEAREIAQAVNADIVIYGDVTVISDLATISPRFYIAESFRSDVGEMTGQHQLALPIEFRTTDIIHFDSEVNDSLRERTGLLIEFTKALTYLAADNLDQSFEAIKKAIQLADSHGDFEGQEVLFLFASTIARLMGDFELSQEYVDRALDLNESYARAYIAQANIFYDQQDFDSALSYYERATQIENQPYGAYIVEKSNVGIGNIYNFMYQIADESEKPLLAEKAISHYQVVIQEYQSASNPHLRDLVALAYYGSGIIFQREGDFDEAREAFEQSLALTQDSELETRIETRLEEVK